MLNPKYLCISRKWVGFVTAIWVQSIAGNNYTFSNYSPDLKEVMHYNQVQLNNLGVAKDVGKSFGLVAGLLADFLPTWAILLIGAVEGAVGYGTQYLVVAQKISPPSYWQMCIVLCLGGNSTTWMNTAVLVTCMRNFPRSRGTVTGTLKGYIGLSTAIFTTLCTALFTSQASSFLLLLTILPAIVCVIAIAFLAEVPPSSSNEEDAEEQSQFTIINWISLSLAFYLLSFTLVQNFYPLSTLQFKLFAVVLLLFLVAPIAIPINLMARVYQKSKFNKSEADSTKKPLLEDDSTENGAAEVESNQSDLEHVEDGNEIAAKKATLIASPSDISVVNLLPALGEDHTLSEALMTIDFWLLFFTFLCGIGTGITAINNLGQIGEAQGFTDVSIFISLISIWGFFGRISAGAISEYYVKKAAVPRPVWMALSQVFLLLGYILFATAAPGSLYLGSIVVGVCYGVHISITVPTASELFGLKYFGILYNFLILNIPLGSFLFSGLLAGWLYDREAAKMPHLGTWSPRLESAHQVMSVAQFPSLGSLGDPNKCIGSHCFRSVFIVMAGMCVFGIILNVILILRIRPLYQELYGPNGSIERKRSSQSRSAR